MGRGEGCHSGFCAPKASGLSGVEERTHEAIKEDRGTGSKPGKVGAKWTAFWASTLRVALSRESIVLSPSVMVVLPCLYHGWLDIFCGQRRRATCSRSAGLEIRAQWPGTWWWDTVPNIHLALGLTSQGCQVDWCTSPLLHLHWELQGYQPIDIAGDPPLEFWCPTQ